MLDLIGAACAAGMALVAILKLTWLNGVYNKAERIGLGLIGGPSFMLMLSLMEGEDSPFRLWAFTIFMVGNFVYFLGRFSREIRHHRANEQAKEQARQHFERKAAR